MNEFLLNFQIYAQPVAFALLLVSGVKLFLNNRCWTLAVFTVGMTFMLLSQLIMFGSYHLFPAAIGSDGGLVPDATRESLMSLSMALYGLGLLAGSIGFAIYSFSLSSRGSA